MNLFLSAYKIHLAGGGGGTGNNFSAFSTGGTGVFYRVGVEEPDTDRDGLPDWREFEEGAFASLQPFDLGVDANRDGLIDKDDDVGKADFTNTLGAVYVVNYDHDEGRLGLAENTRYALARLSTIPVMQEAGRDLLLGCRPSIRTRMAYPTTMNLLRLNLEIPNGGTIPATPNSTMTVMASATLRTTSLNSLTLLARDESLSSDLTPNLLSCFWMR